MNWKRVISLLGSSSLFLALALGWSHIFSLIRRQFTLTPSSLGYKMWSNIPVPIYMEFYIFDWVNAKEFELNPSVVKPRFKEVGPFVYREDHGRVNVSWSEDGSTISYNQTRTWKFIPEESENLSVPITNLNGIALTIGYMSRTWKLDLHRKIANTLINTYEGLFVTAPAENWLFKGITHNLLERLNVLRKVVHIPIPYEKFGWFYERNGSAEFEGCFMIKTGINDIYELGDLVTWNGMTKTDYFEDECGDVKGSAGELLAPVKKYQTSITAFSADLCSYLSLNYAGDVTVKGVNGQLYEGDGSVFDDGKLYPKNRCFTTGDPTPAGTRNVSGCKFGSPAFVSFPHFYLADPVYRNMIDGMDPNKEKHCFRMKIEPRTGVPLEINAAIQINFLLKPYKECKIYENVKEVYIPMLWFKQRAEISPTLAVMINLFNFMEDYGGVILFCLAEGLLLIIALVLSSKRDSVTSRNEINNFAANG
ncbi:UNVERIFIED_CONTAM: hypothetical protein PYX00_009356 [Menopon gallinae]|uniref:Uncharacterized protein n=1 Tax=Menopon gallinae TaxID=328185 RepID=A0AAW2HAQ5_9NEOP